MSPLSRPRPLRRSLGLASLLLAACGQDTKFGLVNNEPGVVITFPADSDHVLEGEAVTLTANVEDDHDDPVDIDFVWSADPGGTLAGTSALDGSVTSLVVEDGFGPGTVTLTVEAIDTSGESGTDTVAFEVDPNTAP